MKSITKRLISSFLSLMLLAAAIVPSQFLDHASAAPVNLIADSGFETPSSTDPTTPANWTAESWGTNTASFSYLNTGHTGSHAAQTTVSNYQSGDAKWIFDPVAVTPNTQYTYSDWSEATTTTGIVAQYTMQDGTVQYQWLDNFDSSTSWVQNTINFTTPANVAEVSIFHIMSANGTLTIDDADMQIVPATSNLIANPDFELSNGSTPANWATNSWGTNTASFSYTTNSHGGTHAAQTTVSNYQSGDAKWIFTPVGVSPSAQYTYSDWYEATAATNLWAQYTMADGTVQYQLLSNVSPAASWTQTSVNFTTPANVATMTVFHVLAANGSLTIDDANLMLTPSCDVSNANGLYNGGFEQTCPSDPNTPADWSTESFGTPNATYNYSTTAHGGSRSVETTMTGTSGEAGWQTAWQPVAANQRYGLTFWQNGTAYVYAYVAVRLSDGSVQYMSLMSVPATQNTGWSQYSDNFVTPAGATQIQVTIATSEPGSFYLDDVFLNSLSNQTPATFNKGVVSLTFDDGDASTYNNGFATLKTDGLKGTFYINAGTLGTSGYMTKADVKNLAAAGDEIGSHGYQHTDIVTLTQAQLASQLTQNNTALHTLLGANYPITDYASPYGSYTSTALDTVMSYYQSHRTTDGRVNTKANLNPRTLHAVLVTSSMTPAQVEALITQAAQQDEYLVLVYHAIGASPTGGDGSGYATTPAHFTTEMNFLKTANVTVLPVNAALTTLEAQE